MDSAVADETTETPTSEADVLTLPTVQMTESVVNVCSSPCLDHMIRGPGQQDNMLMMVAVLS